jgi:hypothetical protein
MTPRLARLIGLSVLLTGLLLASVGQARQVNWRRHRAVPPVKSLVFKSYQGKQAIPAAQRQTRAHRASRLAAPLAKIRPRVAAPLAKIKLGMGRLWAKHPSRMATWAISSGTLGLAETTYLASKTTPLISGLQRLGFWGGLGLTYSATRDMKKAKNASERMDAVGDLAWGLEGAFEFSPIFSNGLGKLAPIVGTIGGFCQTGVGLRRIWRGVKQRDWCKVKLGGLDLASGVLWLAWDLFGVENPVTVCGFVGLMIGREVYANRGAIKASFKHGAKKLKRGIRRTKARARLMRRKVRKWRDHRRDQRQQRRLSNLRQLGSGLDR